MELKLKTYAESDYLRADVSGQYNFEQIIKFYRNIMDECEKSQQHKLLIDVRGLEGTISFFDRFNIANLVQEYIHNFIRIVILIDENPAYKEKIFETVASNRGVLVKICTNEKDALHLLEEIDQYSSINR